MRGGRDGRHARCALCDLRALVAAPPATRCRKPGRAQSSESTRWWPVPIAKRALRAGHRRHGRRYGIPCCGRCRRSAGLPFAAIRIIVDPAHRPLPPAALAAAAPRWNAPRRRRSCARSFAMPRQFAALMRVAFDARAARAALLRGRRLLGPRLAFPDFSQHLLDMPREDVLGGPLAVEGNFAEPSRPRCVLRVAPSPSPSTGV